MNKTLIIMLLLVLCLMSVPVMALTAEEIIQRRDDNEYLASARMEADMIIEQGNRRLTKTMTAYSRKEEAFVHFTNPRDRGTKFLKRGDNLWMFFPDAEDIVKMSGHMLERGMMGSDFSYKDMMESDKLTELYNFEIVGEEEYQDRPCYLLEGIKEEGAEVSYYRRLVWIDKERFLGLKEELYAESGRLLKEARTLEVDKIDDRWYPMESVMENKLRKNTQTFFVVKSIEFNPDLPEGVFTIDNLRN